MKRWKRKACGCVRTRLLVTNERVVIRCQKHRGKAVKKGQTHAYFDEDGIVRRA